MSEKICKNCRFYRKHSPRKYYVPARTNMWGKVLVPGEWKTGEDPKEGSCRRYPPQLIVKVSGGTERTSSHTYQRVPVVSEDFDCGEWNECC